MIEITHPFGVETDWVEKMAVEMGGYVEGNYTIVPDELHTGTRYTLAINEDITVLLADVTYHQDVLFRLRNDKTDFAGIYFNLTEGESIHIMDEVSRSVGRWNYNLAIIDAHLDLDYLVKAGSKSYNISIFVKKRMLREYLAKMGILNKVLDTIFDEAQNTIIHYDHMSGASWHIINEFRKSIPGSVAYDLFLSATVYNLLSDYLEHLMKREILIGKLSGVDVSLIMASQASLTKNVTGVFPGIASLAAQACMSETKYKMLYKKITGFSPNAFFLNNKLELSRELLASGHYTVGEISDKLNFTNPSHLTELFKNHFGVLPKDYVNLL
ncbi:MAG: AraC family transcriptional regulator [Pedobacter sp.]|uniref:helix-turn-helix transcriptional regulator n=1 Tax=Pedobacter sp. TaxID=1411316 RepID=UPI003564E5BC